MKITEKTFKSYHYRMMRLIGKMNAYNDEYWCKAYDRFIWDICDYMRMSNKGMYEELKKTINKACEKHGYESRRNDDDEMAIIKSDASYYLKRFFVDGGYLDGNVWE